MGFDKSLNSLSYLRVKEVPNQEALEQAIALYRQEEISLGRAAEMAGITRWELMHLLKARGTPVTVKSRQLKRWMSVSLPSEPGQDDPQ